MVCQGCFDGCHGHLARASTAALARRQWHPTRHFELDRPLITAAPAVVRPVRGQRAPKEPETMFSPTLQLAVGMIPLVLLALAVAVRPKGDRPSGRAR